MNIVRINGQDGLDPDLLTISYLLRVSYHRKRRLVGNIEDPFTLYAYPALATRNDLGSSFVNIKTLTISSLYKASEFQVQLCRCLDRAG